ncbi:metal ABC transporter solute-binding protein, Zn/Mn family [Methylobacterium frigidaeris]|uniref:Manganese-binding lipoprotein MntA n=1 Tax=Methylobacterium frigidaeris TaxID=2038277 RepID=A0AA37H7F7_9HYPH|nr:zinc ABC transporter substrate-binding protein [Methylobacterium frigidaeris]PIK74374.1 ABC transporter substrate-binding protein [Methylobacterium frigidaeris]GJD60783.1 Manganese-binding lipoprotein MntA [Methylobacterium frigidaeris]
MGRLRIGMLLLVLGMASGLARIVPARAEEPVRVVATFSILGDLVRQVGGARVAVTTLVGPNGDAHSFVPAPADAQAVAAARLVVVNGLGFEGWIDRLIKASGTRAKVVVAATGIVPIEEDDGDGHGQDHGQDHGHSHAADPHAWQNVANTKRYVANIRDGLVSVDPEGKAAYQANAAAYLTQLDGLDAEVRAALAGIPEARRRIVTTHDAFGYFARAYGLRFLAPQGVSSQSEATARDVAAIVRQVRRDKVPAVFLENISDPRLMQQIARESGAKAGGRVFSDALSEPGGPAPTYLEMMRHNVKEFVAALSG